MIYIGIDPGKTGAVAVIDCYDTKASFVTGFSVWLMNIKGCLDSAGLTTVCVEEPIMMPSRTFKSMKVMLGNYYQIVGACAALSVPCLSVAPKRWQGELLKDQPRGPATPRGSGKATRARLALARRKALKAASVVVASRLYPHLVGDGPLTDGEADAICIAEYGRRTRSAGELP